MALNVNCDGFQRDRYFSRSWALITQDEGWIKPVLLLTLAQLVPILGPLGATGYTVEWARLIAWNTNAAPKQHNVNIGECIVSGWRSFLVCLGWGILAFFAFSVLALVPILGPLLVFAAAIFCIYLNQLLRVAVLRASIYQQVGAGYKAGRIWEMGERDVDGLMHIIGIEFIAGMVVGVVLSVLASIVFITIVPSLVQMVSQIDAMYYTDSAEEAMAVIQRLLNVFVGAAPGFVVLGLIGSFVTTLLNLILMGAVGLWMRQFNVPAWGRSDDPLPMPLPETVVYYQNAPYAPNQAYGYASQQPNYDQAYGQTYDQTYAQTYDPGYVAQQQAYEQAYNQAYEQAYGYPPQEAPAPETQYVPEATIVPETQIVEEAASAPEFVSGPVGAAEPAPASEAAPLPEVPLDAQ